MITGIEPILKRIAQAMTDSIPAGWQLAEFHARFYPKTSVYEAEHVDSDNVAHGFQPASDGSRSIRELRRQFKESGKPVWGECWLQLTPKGTFNLQWGYEGCDLNGDLVFNEESELLRHEERRLRLIAGKPRQNSTVDS